MRITGIAHVCIGAKDLEATERFYCASLGFTKVFEFVRQGKTIGYYLKAGERNFVEVFQKDDLAASDKHPIRHLCLETADLDGVAAALKAGGYEVTDKKVGNDRSWQCWTTDPNGVRIEFHQYTPQSSQLTGATCVLG